MAADLLDQPVFFGDDPIEGSGQDIFSRGEYAQRVAEIVLNVASHRHSTVLALVGPWGCGKTSLLNLVEEQLNATEQLRVVRFNPWLVSDLASLVSGYFASLLPAIGVSKELRKRLVRYARALSPLASLIQTPGINIGSVLRISIDKSADLLEGDQSLDAQKSQIEKDLESIEVPIVVVIDDIDRLHPDELMLVFKLVRMVGRLPNVHYLLAYDETTVLDVIARSEIAAEKRDRARAYLEKMAQVRLDIPPLRPTQSRELFETLLSTFLARHGVDLIEGDRYRLWRIYGNHLEGSLREPREVKRFCGHIEAFYPLVGSEVDFVDFAVVTWLRLFYPEILNVLIEHKAELTGTALVIGDKPSQKEAADKWRGTIEDANAACDVGDMLELLSELFPALEKAVSPFGRFVTDKGRSDSKRIGSVEYFDRYIYLGVGPDDISDSEISQALAEALRREPGSAWAKMVDSLPTRATLIVDKLRRLAPDGAQSTERLLPLLCGLSKHIPSQPTSLRPPIAILQMWVARLLPTVIPPDPRTFTRQLADGSGVPFLSGATAEAKRSLGKRGQSPSPEFGSICDTVEELVVEYLDSQSRLDPAETERVIHVLWDWETLNPSAPREWTIKTMYANAWDPVGFAAMFVIEGLGGAHPSGRCLIEPQMESINQFIGLEELKDRIGDPSEHPGYQMTKPASGDLSFAARQRVALRFLFQGKKSFDD